MQDDWWERRAERMERKFERHRMRSERRRQRHYRDYPGKHLFTGLILLSLGVIFLLGNMGFVEPGRILRFWPVILIALGAFRLIEGRDDFAHNSGIFWIVVGGLFLLSSEGFLRIALRDFWPIVLIGLGALMLWRSVFVRRATPPGNFSNGPAVGTSSFQADAGTEQQQRSDQARGSATTSSNSIISAMAVLGSVEQRNNSQDFRGGSATAVMGRCEIDLRAAAIAGEQEPVLEVFAVWGGIEVRVPPDWTVISQVDPIMGGYEDHTQPPKETTKRFVIRGPVIMGGIEVTN